MLGALCGLCTPCEAPLPLGGLSSRPGLPPSDGSFPMVVTADGDLSVSLLEEDLRASGHPQYPAEDDPLLSGLLQCPRKAKPVYVTPAGDLLTPDGTVVTSDGTLLTSDGCQVRPDGTLVTVETEEASLGLLRCQEEEVDLVPVEYCPGYYDGRVYSHHIAYDNHLYHHHTLPAHAPYDNKYYATTCTTAAPPTNNTSGCIITNNNNNKSTGHHYISSSPCVTATTTAASNHYYNSLNDNNNTYTHNVMNYDNGISVSTSNTATTYDNNNYLQPFVTTSAEQDDNGVRFRPLPDPFTPL